MNDPEVRPLHVSIAVDAQQRTRIWVSGTDITRHCAGVSVDARPGAVPAVWFKLIGVTLDVEADVPPDYVRALTLEQEEANQEARQERDVDRGLRTPRALLDVSLGQVKP
jgi:hypothetical protein